MVISSEDKLLEKYWKGFMLIPINDEIKENENWVNLNCISNLAPIYMISNWGRVYNEETKTIIPKNYMYDKDKYITIRLRLINGSHICQQPHRLVCMTFKPILNSNLYEVNHIDGIKFHNWVWNLEWCTRQENVDHSLNNNLVPFGEDRTNSKLTNDQVEQICYLLETGLSTNEIANLIDYPNVKIKSIVNNIRARLSWKSISNKYIF